MHYLSNQVQVPGHPSTVAVAPMVLDSSSLQRFPESGWTCVRDRYLPAPTLKWFRPRHGCPALVVPTRNPLKLNVRKAPAKLPTAAVACKQFSILPPPPPPYPKLVSRPPILKPTDSIYSDSIMSSVPAVETKSNNRRVNTKNTRKNNESLGTPNDGEGSLNVTIDQEVDIVTTATTATSSFRIYKGRERVSLADASIATSVLDDQSSVLTYEI